jgi:thiamine-phosphate pyrophosphorylase
VYETPSKREYGAPRGVVALAEACRRVGMPILAIGGVTVESLSTLRGAGALGVAVIRALLDAEEPGRATAELLAAWTRAAG